MICISGCHTGNQQWLRLAVVWMMSERSRGQTEIWLQQVFPVPNRCWMNLQITCADIIRHQWGKKYIFVHMCVQIQIFFTDYFIFYFSLLNSQIYSKNGPRYELWLVNNRSSVCVCVCVCGSVVWSSSQTDTTNNYKAGGRWSPANDPPACLCYSDALHLGKSHS